MLCGSFKFFLQIWRSVLLILKMLQETEFSPLKDCQNYLLLNILILFHLATHYKMIHTIFVIDQLLNLTLIYFNIDRLNTELLILTD